MFKTNVPNDPKNDLDPYKVKDTLYTYFFLSLSLKFQWFHATPNHFGVTGYFETSAITPKIALKLQRLKVPHIHAH